MEVVIFSAGAVLRDQIRRAVEAALTYRQGALLSLYPDMPATGAELLQLARSDRSWLVIAQTGGDPAWLELCEAFQRRADRAWFLLLGRGAAECLAAVQRHLHLADYLLEQDPRLDDALRESLNRFTGGVVPLCGGLFTWRDETFHLTPFEEICYIETIKRTHRCAVVGRSARGELRCGIEDLIRRLDERFCLCRPSTIANLANVRGIDLKDRCLYFGGGLSCGFSASKRRFMRQLSQNSPSIGNLCYIKE